MLSASSAASAASQIGTKRNRDTRQPARILPGVALCAAVSAAAYGLEGLERALTEKALLEALVLAILIGTAVRSVWSPGKAWHAGIRFSAKVLLECAVVLLGLSVSAQTILAAGPALLVGIALVVMLAIGLGFTIGRALGLPPRMALLIACGNSICGNSAIAAVAPVIRADNEDVAASIAFTAVLGVVTVLALPVFGIAWGMSSAGLGAFAGLIVYAVPQVLAAASPLGPVAVQMGTLVKLMRVLMLGPVCIALSFIAPRLGPLTRSEIDAVAAGASPRHPGLSHLMPWFIVGFLALLALRSSNLVPAAVLAPASHLASGLTVLSMAALGLGVDVRTVAAAGARVTAAVVLSLLGLATISLILLHLLSLV